MIRQIKFKNLKNEVLIPNQEVTRGVVIPNILVKSNKAFIRFLNTDDNIIKKSIKQNRIKTGNFSVYNVITQRLNKVENGQ